MVKLTIQGQAYKLPEELTISQWKSLLPYDYHDVKDWPRIIGQLLNRPSKEFELATIESMTLAISFVIVLMNQRKAAQVKDFNDILFGEFVDLDIYTVEGIEKRLEQALEILCDKPKQLSSAEALWVIDQFSLFRQHTYRSYSGLFGLNDVMDELDIDSEGWDPKKIAKGWYRIIVDLAGDDLLKIDEVTDQPLKKTLNYMALKKEKQLEENFRLQQQQRKHDLSRNRK